MVRGKRRNGVWHHRVPDFKLVYCGSNKISIIKDENKKAGTILQPEKRLE